jgi:endoglucanase Acf2
MKTSETVPLSGRPRRQYNYFYGSTTDANDSLTVATNDTHSLIGEALVATDNEEETLNNSHYDIRRISISKRKSGLPWLMCVTPAGTGLGGVLLILVLAVAISTSAIFLMPHSSRPMLESQFVVVPYGQVSRADYGDPVEGFLNMDLFYPTLLSPDDRRAFNFPFPTGAFWTNLVVPSPDSVYSYPIVVYPYAYKWSKDSLQLSYPAAHRLDDANHHWIIDTFAPELTISTSEAIEARYVTKFDPLSVSLRYFSSPGSKWETTLVQGSPYTTIKYIDSTPTLKALSTFKSVQCPGDEAEDFHDFVEDSDDDGGSTGRRLFGVCSVEVGY